MAKEYKDEEVFKKDGFHCVYCGFDGRSFTGWTFLIVDHFKPKWMDGGHDEENLKTACCICNLMKAGKVYKTVEEAGTELRLWRSQMQEYWEKNVKHLVPTI
jgi:5-methylcytosine-specific restriction endonuclease McrA